MKYDSYVHHRQSIRLRDYDYSQEGAYFVTMCTRNRECYFDEYPALKQIVERQLLDIPNRFQNVELDEFVVMPNHVHGIIMVVGATIAVALDVTDAASDRIAPNRAGASPAPTNTIGDIIGTFKSLCVHEWLKYIKQHNTDAVGKFWQRNYYEHVIRNDIELNKIREYVIANPQMWDSDEENPANL